MKNYPSIPKTQGYFTIFARIFTKHATCRNNSGIAVDSLVCLKFSGRVGQSGVVFFIRRF